MIPVIGALVPFLGKVASWVPFIGKIFGVLSSIWLLIVKVLAKGNIWMLWMLSSTVLFVFNIIRGQAAKIGGIINNFIIGILDKILSALTPTSLSDIVDMLPDSVIGLLSYTGAVEAVNVLSLGVVALVATYVTWWLIFSVFKFTVGAVL